MPTKSYVDDLKIRLSDPDYAAGYLSECYQDSVETFLLGLKYVVEAQGGYSELSKSTRLSREHLYTMLSESGNPRLQSLSIILRELGFKMTIEVDEDVEDIEAA